MNYLVVFSSCLLSVIISFDLYQYFINGRSVKPWFYMIMTFLGMIRKIIYVIN